MRMKKEDAENACNSYYEIDQTIEKTEAPIDTPKHMPAQKRLQSVTV